MALIVQKFGGSSVKDRNRIFNVARIVANTHKAGNDVVVVVSAQGDTTDDLIAKAAEITHNPSAREMDMLLAAGEEISIALLAIATEDKLHQPYRMPLMPGSKEAFALAKQCGAKAVYVSGAGSTVMAVAERTDAEEFYKGLEAGLEQLEGLDGCEAFTLLRLDADNTGATVE